jgi:hypothetical protein
MLVCKSLLDLRRRDLGETYVCMFREDATQATVTEMFQDLDRLGEIHARG